MDKNAIRDFAVKARYKLTSEIANKARMIGISEDGVKAPLSQSTNDIQYFDIGGDIPFSIQGGDISKRHSFIEVIDERKKSGQSQKDAFWDTIEEIAYTWFNRIIAIRFMEVNDFLPSGIRVLSSTIQGKKEPDLVTNYLDADLNLTNQDVLTIEQLKSKNKPDFLFKFLFIKQCNKLGEILPFLFEKTADYQELMLSISYTDEQGIVNQLVSSIKEDDFKEAVEIIGWTYQYYIAQKKEEVFKGLKNNTKITKSTLPSATQIFTPDWIVKYMTDNTLGKMWIESHKNSNIKNVCEYYLEPAKQSEEVQKQLDEINKIYATKKLEEITFLDPCCGSGHILVYAFDLFYKMYQEQGYVSSEIPSLIIKNNLYGIDVDKRAMQLTCFALIMKARSYDKRYFKRPYIQPNVINIKESNGIIYDTNKQIFDKNLKKILTSKEIEVVDEVISKFEDAELYGSLVKDFNHTPNQYLEVYQKLNSQTDKISFNIDGIITKTICNNYLLPLLTQAQMLSNKYDIVVTNPPYASTSGLDIKVSEFGKTYYPNSKYDLYAMFIERCCVYTKVYGLYAMISMKTWMFISRYLELRKSIIGNVSIINILDLGMRAFGGDVGTIVQSAVFVNMKSKISNYNSLSLDLQNGLSSEEKKEIFFKKNLKSYSSNFIKIYSIPGFPFSYWISPKFLEIYQGTEPLENFAPPRQGMATSNNNKFIRMWYEVQSNKLNLHAHDSKEAKQSKCKWFPYNKGGSFRKWYGNIENVINWENDGKEVKKLAIDLYGSVTRTIKNIPFYFHKAISWPYITENTKFGARYIHEGFLFDVAGSSVFGDKDILFYLMSLMCSKLSVEFMRIVNPTMNFQVENIKSIPIKIARKNEINSVAERNVNISKIDWDKNETSWDFAKSPLI